MSKTHALSAFFSDVPQMTEGGADTINRLHHELKEILLSGALKAFEIGKMLDEVKNSCPPRGEKSFPRWMEENLTFSPQSANSYLRIYERYKDNPEQLEGLTIGGALAEKKQRITDTRHIEKQYDFEEIDFKAIFERNPISKIALKEHRVEVYGDEVWGFRKDFGRFPLCDLRIAKPASLPLIEWEMVKKALQVVFERYFEKIERYEEMGGLEKPQKTLQEARG